MTIVKICGIVDVAGGLAAIDAGAQYLGFVFYPPSSRALDSPSAAGLISRLRAQRPGGWGAVGVFVNEPIAVVEEVRRCCVLDIVQLNGEETRDYISALGGPVFKALRYPEGGNLPSAASFGAERVLVDANVPGRYGGTGMPYDWSRVRTAVSDGFLAGGLTPENVSEALAQANPWGVDVSSGVERNGSKSPELIQRFLDAVRQADAPSRKALVR
jgi:phosphoribosylanthranilate isomerase